MDNPDLLEQAKSWAWTHSPQLYAAGMSAVIAVLRVAYGRGHVRQMLFEGLLCGCLTLALAPLLRYLNLPSDMVMFVGGALGFMGVDRVRALAQRYADRKLPKA